MRDQIRAWLIEGKDRTWIEDQFVAQYGPSILGAPRMTGWGLLAWATPPLALFFGFVGVVSFLKRRQGDPGEEVQEAAAAPPSADDGEISEIEKRVDEEIGDWTK
jgi:cytochrome c-type biogenesis protein CcmH/NrfF